MKKSHFLALLFLIPFAFPWEGGSSVRVGIPAKGIFFEQSAIPYLPSIDLDVSDLDVRDAENKPLKSSALQDQLKTLFAENLFRLMAVADGHAIQQAWSSLDTFSRLFRNLIFNCAPAALEALQEAFLPPSKRFVHNVGNMWITLSVGIFLASSLLAASRSQRSTLQLILRC